MKSSLKVASLDFISFLHLYGGIIHVTCNTARSRFLKHPLLPGRKKGCISSVVHELFNFLLIGDVPVEKDATRLQNTLDFADSSRRFLEVSQILLHVMKHQCGYHHVEAFIVE